MNKIFVVLLVMIMLCSAMLTLGVSANDATIVVTQATMDNSGNITVRGTYTSSTPGAVTILATIQNTANGKENLKTMSDRNTVAYADQTTPASDGKFEFKFKPKAGLEGSHTTIYVCAAGITLEKLFAENLTGNEVTVNYGTISKPYTSKDGVVTISLRPAEIAKTPVATLTGYFKQWDIMGVKSNTEGAKKEVEVSDIRSGILTAKPEFFDDPAHTSISKAMAQKVTLANGKNAIRFLALVGKDYENYDDAGFVFSTLGENPTVEAGYKAYPLNELYKKVKVFDNVLDIIDPNFTGGFGVDFEPAGILFANVVVADEDTVYYATPYLEDARNNRVYGATKQASFNQLVLNDGQ